MAAQSDLFEVDLQKYIDSLDKIAVELPKIELKQSKREMGCSTSSQSDSPSSSEVDDTHNSDEESSEYANTVDCDEVDLEETSEGIEDLELEGDLKKFSRHKKKLCKSAFKTIASVVEELSDEKVQGNAGTTRYGTTPAQVWEYFAVALLPCFSRQLFGRGPVHAEHCGKVDDKGADVLLYYPPEKLKAVVQVKRGKYFEKGKGNNVVLCLVGSCVYYGVHTGIIFSNESAEELKASTKELIEEFGKRGYTIKCLFKANIPEDNVSGDFVDPGVTIWCFMDVIKHWVIKEENCQTIVSALQELRELVKVNRDKK